MIREIVRERDRIYETAQSNDRGGSPERHVTPRAKRTSGEIVGNENKIIDPLPKLKPWNDFYYSCAVFGPEFGRTLVARGSQGLEMKPTKPKIERKVLYRSRVFLGKRLLGHQQQTGKKEKTRLKCRACGK